MRPPARIWSVALHGVDGVPVEIEAVIGGGMPGVHLVGLPDAALNESKDRVRSAIVHSGPHLAPTSGSCSPSPRRHCARPAAALRLSSHGARRPGRRDAGAARRLRGTVLLGELALDGRLRPVRACCPACSPRGTPG
ncbi:magnesium chelatase domain-containing protein [Pseudonocardia sp. ICBG601]|uniref:magnesium chelatase domain-containing protein n=1 Tax=Pseudonocardia sp. ICBG601 TaxID=2846759 RepID=UPI001CF6E0DF|nr:magnesium chelatase domain-containing protein [Pseudonocardia sp. ICBG601]